MNRVCHVPDNGPEQVLPGRPGIWVGGGGLSDVSVGEDDGEDKATKFRATHLASGLSMIRCGDYCSTPELLPGGRLLYTPSTDRELKLKWSKQPPKNFLFVKKWKDPEVTREALELALWLTSTHDAQVFMIAEEELPPGITLYDPAAHSDVVDVVVCMGGDGTVLFLSSLFQGPGATHGCPPVPLP